MLRHVLRGRADVYEEVAPVMGGQVLELFSERLERTERERDELAAENGGLATEISVSGN